MKTAPDNGRELLDWIGHQAGPDRLYERAKRLGAERGYPSMIQRWNADQVADVYHDLTQKPDRGESRWGGTCGRGPADSGHAPPSPPERPCSPPNSGK